MSESALELAQELANHLRAEADAEIKYVNDLSRMAKTAAKAAARAYREAAESMDQVVALLRGDEGFNPDDYEIDLPLTETEVQR